MQRVRIRTRQIESRLAPLSHASKATIDLLLEMESRNLIPKGITKIASIELYKKYQREKQRVTMELREEKENKCKVKVQNDFVQLAF